MYLKTTQTLLSFPTFSCKSNSSKLSYILLLARGVWGVPPPNVGRAQKAITSCRRWFFSHWSEGMQHTTNHFLDLSVHNIALITSSQFPTVFALLCPRASRGLRVDTIIFFYFFFTILCILFPYLF